VAQTGQRRRKLPKTGTVPKHGLAILRSRARLVSSAWSKPVFVCLIIGPYKIGVLCRNTNFT